MSKIKVPALWVAVVLSGVWGLALIIVPNTAHPLLSGAPMNAVTTGMFGAALVGLALVALSEVVKDFSCRQAIGSAAAVLAGMALYLMFVTGAMVIGPATIVSLALAIAIAVILII